MCNLLFFIFCSPFRKLQYLCYSCCHLLFSFFLPFNIAPTIVVWCYLKLLQCSEFALLFVEAIQVVLVVMYISQSFVNEIEDQPVIVKVFYLTKPLWAFSNNNSVSSVKSEATCKGDFSSTLC